MLGQPSLDTALPCGLNPTEIIAAVIRDTHESGASYGTSLNPETFNITQMVSNDRTGYCVRLGYREETVTEADNSSQSFGAYLCELQIDNVYVWGAWNVNISFAGESELDWAQHKAEEAFMRCATLIGKRTERQIVVLD